MNREQLNAISDVADTIRKHYGISTPIQENCDSLIRRIGGELKIESALTKARIVRTDGDHDFEMIVPRRSDDHMMKDIIGLMLGHLFLHMQYNIYPDKWENAVSPFCVEDTTESQEEKAKIFYFSLFMPRDEFIDVFLQNTKNDHVLMSGVAKYFDVSADTAAVWARALRLIN